MLKSRIKTKLLVVGFLWGSLFFGLGHGVWAAKLAQKNNHDLPPCHTQLIKKTAQGQAVAGLRKTAESTVSNLLCCREDRNASVETYVSGAGVLNKLKTQLQAYQAGQLTFLHEIKLSMIPIYATAPPSGGEIRLQNANRLE